jgi:hypothetical protein
MLSIVLVACSSGSDPSGEAELTECSGEAQPARDVQAYVTVSNDGDSVADYLVTVSFNSQDSGNQIDSASAQFRGVSPGQSSRELVRSGGYYGMLSYDCEIVQVDKTSN